MNYPQIAQALVEVQTVGAGKFLTDPGILLPDLRASEQVAEDRHAQLVVFADEALQHRLVSGAEGVEETERRLPGAEVVEFGHRRIDPNERKQRLIRARLEAAGKE